MKKYILSIILLLSSLGLTAQISVSNTSAIPNSKWIFGGTAGAGFLGGNGFSIYGTPTIGYQLLPNLVGGLSGSFSYQTSRYSRSFVFGAGPFLKYYIGRSFYATADYRLYFINQRIKNSGESFNKKEGALNLGAGYIRHLGGNTFLEVGASYNVLYNRQTSILGSPFVPYVGIVIGL